MILKIKNKDSLVVDDFKFKCSCGKNGFSTKKIEGDGRTPKGIFSLGKIYYRKDRVSKPRTKLKVVSLKKNMYWCDDPRSKNYNKLINFKDKYSSENLYRKDNKYNYILEINYNKRNIKNKGSAIFLHLTKNYKKTQGCISLTKKDFLILTKVIESKNKIRIG